MLVAVNRNGRLINLMTETPEKQDFFCPACKSALRLRSGPIKLPHFAHISLENCESWSENESFQHLSLKKAIYLWATKTEKVKMEEYLPELKQTPDLLLSDQIAIEIQCSRLSIERLFERTKNYEAHDYKVIWLMGKDLWLKSRLSSLQKNLLYFSMNSGFHYWELDLERKCIRLKYMIHQNLKGKISYLYEEFTFGDGSFLEIMRRPFLAQKLQSLPVKQDENIHRFIQRELHYRASKWMQLQEIYYQEGKHILTENFTVQWTPIGLDPLTGKKEENFCQVSDALKAYYEKFLKYHQKYHQKSVFSPAFYDKIYK